MRSSRFLLNENRALFKGLFRHIPKNRVILPYLASIQPTNPIPNHLLNAIVEGKADAPVFKEKDCYLYLLHLIEQEKIPFWQGMTVYAYLMATTQFTHRVSVDKLMDENKLTPIGEKYLRGVCKHLEDIGHILHYEALANDLLQQQLQATEQWLFKIPFRYSKNSIVLDDSERLTQIIVPNLPLLYYEAKAPQAGTGTYWMPSLTVFNYLLGKISPKPLRMQPIFGSINPTTLFQFHANETHPLQLHARDVKSNPREVHGEECGPFPMLIHDLYHTVSATLLTFDERQTLFNRFIPLMKGLQQKAEQHGNTEFATTIKHIIDEVVDFDIFPSFFTQPSTRFRNYLLKGMNQQHIKSQEDQLELNNLFRQF